jgi:hypothetical protein
VELGGDLFRRAPLLEKAKHLDLTRSEVRVRRRRSGVETPFDQT